MKHGIVRIGTAFYFNLEKALGTTKYPKGHEQTRRNRAAAS